jgi:hypothetical protein
MPDAPFPITVTATIEAPLEASYIDVDSVQITATIMPSSLDSSPAHDIDDSGNGRELFTTTLQIEDTTLPSSLKRAIITELDKVKNNTTDQSVSHVGAVLATLEKEYARLLCLVPECLERYQGEDGAGRTVRRVAILREDAHITIDTSVPHHSLKAAPLPTTASNTNNVDGGGATATATSRSLLSLPRALQAELEALKKRYSLQMIDNVDECSAMLEQLNITSSATAAAPGAAPPSLASPLICNISLSPTDPEWQPQGALLHLTCFISNPTEYPAAGSFGIALEKTNNSAVAAALSPLPPALSSSSSSPLSLTAQESLVCDRLLQMEAAGVAGRPGALRAVLRQCGNRAGELFHQAVDMAIEIERRRAAAAGVVAATNLRREGHEDSESEYSSGSEDWDGHSDGSYNSEEEEEKFTGSTDQQQQQHQEPLLSGQQSSQSAQEGVLLHNSLYLLLSDLNLQDIDTLDIFKLTLQLACQRCRATCEAVFSQLGGGSDSTATGGGGGGSSHRKHLAWKGECSTCHANLEVTLAPRIVHDGSNILAVLRPNGCVPMDMLPSILEAQCSSCSNMAAFRAVQIGQWNERNCGHCHRRMAFLAPAVEFKPVQRGGGGGGRGRGHATGGNDDNNLNNGKNRSAIDIVITPGQPLPEFGRCRHYRHSQRWLRFPCCGQRFPCDLCHEEATDGHEMKWAGRMVCGYCSVEQALDQKCSACGKTLATSANRPSGRRTAFWEGGEGQRDKNRLSKRDPHKFRGSKHKTQSRKAERVGQKGKERTERAAAKGD